MQVKMCEMYMTHDTQKYSETAELEQIVEPWNEDPNSKQWI